MLRGTLRINDSARYIGHGRAAVSSIVSDNFSSSASTPGHSSMIVSRGKSLSFNEDSTSFDEYGNHTTGSAVFSSVIRDVTNRDGRRGSHEQKVRRLFVPEGKTLLEDSRDFQSKAANGGVLKPSVHNKSSRFRVPQNFGKEGNNMYATSSFWEEISQEDRDKRAKKKATQARRDVKERIIRAESRKQESMMTQSSKGAMLSGEHHAQALRGEFASLGAPIGGTKQQPSQTGGHDDDFLAKLKASSSAIDTGSEATIQAIADQDDSEDEEARLPRHRRASRRGLGSDNNSVSLRDGEVVIEDGERSVEDDETETTTVIDENSLQNQELRTLTGLPLQTLEAASPERASAVKLLLRARSTGAVLQSVGSHLEHLDSLGVASALHKLGKLTSPATKQSVLHDPRLEDLLKATSALIPSMDTRSLSMSLWGLVKVEAQPVWLPQLVKRCVEMVNEFEGPQVASLLFCISRIQFPTPEVRLLQIKLVERLHAAPNVLAHDASTLTCILTALAQLKVKDPQLLSVLASRVTAHLDEFDVSSISSIAWSFAALQTTDERLFEGIRRSVEARAESATPRELVNLAWSLSRLGEADADLFTFTIGPLVRSFLLSYDAKELTSLVQSFANANVVDPDLYADLAALLLPKLKSLHAGEVSNLALALAQAKFSNGEMNAALGQHSLKLAPTMTVPQLAKTTYGLALCGVSDLRIFETLANAFTKQAFPSVARSLNSEDSLSGRLVPAGLRASELPVSARCSVTQALQMLQGLAESECLHLTGVLRPLLLTVQRGVKSTSAEDSVQVLHLISKLPLSDESCLSADERRSLVDGLLLNVKTRFKKWKCLDAPTLGDLLEAMHDLRYRDADLLNAIFHQLPNLFLASDRPDFLRLLGALAYLPSEDLKNLRSHVARRADLQKHLAEQLTAFTNKTNTQLSNSSSHGLAGERGGSLSSRVAVAYAATRIGYRIDPANTGRLLDDLRSEIEGNSDEPLRWPLTVASLFAYTVAESGYASPLRSPDNVGWVQPFVSKILSERYESKHFNSKAGGEDEDMGSETALALLRIIWAASVQGMNLQSIVSPSVGNLVLLAVEDIASLLEGSVPPQRELQAARQAVLEMRVQFPAEVLKKSLSSRALLWLDDVLSCPSLSHGSHSNRPGEEDSVLLSSALTSLKIAHKPSFVLPTQLPPPLTPSSAGGATSSSVSRKKSAPGLYKVAAVFPQASQALDVLSLEDQLFPPEGNRANITGTATLRQRQLVQSQGWTVHALNVSDLRASAADGRLKSFIASMLGSAGLVSQQDLNAVGGGQWRKGGLLDHASWGNNSNDIQRG